MIVVGTVILGLTLVLTRQTSKPEQVLDNKDVDMSVFDFNATEHPEKRPESVEHLEKQPESVEPRNWVIDFSEIQLQSMRTHLVVLN